MPDILPGERSLAELMANMSPELNPGTYVYVKMSTDAAMQITGALMRFEEAEGTTLILSRDQAQRLGLEFVFPCRWISLRVHSALDAVGFFAAIAAALSVAGISTNSVAGYHHDHLFVPEADGDRAMDVLRALQKG